MDMGDIMSTCTGILFITFSSKFFHSSQIFSFLWRKVRKEKGKKEKEKREKRKRRKKKTYRALGEHPHKPIYH